MSPARIPASAIAPNMTVRSVVFGRMKTATPVAAHAPMNICPSAPIFHNFMRNAMIQARAVSRMGEVLTNVSESGPKHNIPFGQACIGEHRGKSGLPVCRRAETFFENFAIGRNGIGRSRRAQDKAADDQRQYYAQDGRYHAHPAGVIQAGFDS